MTYVYAIIVVVTAGVHFAFMGYAVLGGFMALRWPRTVWLHVVVVAWCAAIEVVDFVCPLTWLERWARGRASLAPLGSDGFIDHYITGVWYPGGAENVILTAVLVAVLTSWALVALKMARRRSRRPRREVLGRSPTASWTFPSPTTLTGTGSLCSSNSTVSVPTSSPTTRTSSSIQPPSGPTTTGSLD